MDDTKIKEAFIRAKQDIEHLRSQIEHLSFQIEELKRTLLRSQDIERPAGGLHSTPTNQQTQPEKTPTHPPTHSNTPTDNLPLKALKTPFSNISSRNEGVPTDRQTNQQTDQHVSPPRHIPSITPYQPSPSIAHVSQIISSLDEIKHELHKQFKSLTAQEMLIFSTIYQLEEEGQTIDYPLLAKRLKLSESSIRDYILKITRKGIPLHKTKENNKKVRLSISKELKKIASLQTLLTLREL